MELGMHAEKCACTTHCVKGVDPMGDCVARLPGETVTAFCDICDPTHTRMTWHNNGSCISCVRNARQAKKEANALRHAQIMAAPANPVQIEDAELVVPTAPDFNYIPPSTKTDMEILVRVNGIEIPITTDAGRIQRMLKCS